MVVPIALDEAEHQVPDVEGLTPHSTAVEQVQRLLVLRPSGGGQRQRTKWRVTSTGAMREPPSLRFVH